MEKEGEGERERVKERKEPSASTDLHFKGTFNDHRLGCNHLYERELNHSWMELIVCKKEKPLPFIKMFL